MTPLTVIIRCPKCERETILAPRHGEIVAVYCLCQTADTTSVRYPTRMEVLPARERELAPA